MLLYSQGNALITPEEWLEKRQAIGKFYDDLRKQVQPASIDFANGGALTADTVNQKAAAWEPIGYGRPVTVSIFEVYTGKYPTSVFGGKSDVLLTSAVKSYGVFNGQPRAINFIKPALGPRSRFQQDSPDRDGTPIIFYSPALMDRSLTIGLTMVADTFDQTIFDTIASLFDAAAGIPIFLAHATELLTAGAVVKLLGQGGELLFDGKPFFDQTDVLNVSLPQLPVSSAGFVLVSASEAFERDYFVNDSGKVVDRKTKEPYDGDQPYIVLAYDGRADEKLSSFTPTAASAELLSHFFGAKNRQQATADLLVEGMKLVNDMRYRSRVDQIDAKLKNPSLPQTEKDKLQAERDALIKNILTDALRPTGPSVALQGPAVSPAKAG